MSAAAVATTTVVRRRRPPAPARHRPGRVRSHGPDVPRRRPCSSARSGRRSPVSTSWRCPRSRRASWRPARGRGRGRSPALIGSPRPARTGPERLARAGEVSIRTVLIQSVGVDANRSTDLTGHAKRGSWRGCRTRTCRTSAATGCARCPGRPTGSRATRRPSAVPIHRRRARRAARRPRRPRRGPRSDVARGAEARRLAEVEHQGRRAQHGGGALHDHRLGLGTVARRGELANALAQLSERSAARASRRRPGVPVQAASHCPARSSASWSSWSGRCLLLRRSTRRWALFM